MKEIIVVTIRNYDTTFSGMLFNADHVRTINVPDDCKDEDKFIEEELRKYYDKTRKVAYKFYNRQSAIDFLKSRMTLVYSKGEYEAAIIALGGTLDPKPAKPLVIHHASDEDLGKAFVGGFLIGIIFGCLCCAGSSN